MNFAFETRVDFKGDIFFAIGANASARVDYAFETYVEDQVDIFFSEPGWMSGELMSQP